MNPIQPLRELPKTTEGAIQRYCRNYENLYRGKSIEERYRLLDYVKQFTLTLQRKCPHFYETKLAVLINQACSNIMLCDTRKPEGEREFNIKHKKFLTILKGLVESQPAGEINYDTECRRIDIRDNLKKEAVRLGKELEILNSSEFSTETLGDEDEVFERIEKTKNQYIGVLRKLAFIDGDRVEEEDDAKFELHVKDSTRLKLLNKEVLDLIEEKVLNFLKANKKRPEEEKSLFDEVEAKKIIDSIDLELYDFSADDLKIITKELVEAYRKYFRLMNKKLNDLRHQYWLETEAYKPKEGLILKDEFDVPEHVEKKLKQHEREADDKRKDLAATFEQQQDNETNDNVVDVFADYKDSTEDDEEIEFLEHKRVEEDLKKELKDFVRVKEEVNKDDDYDRDDEPYDEDDLLPTNEKNPASRDIDSQPGPSRSYHNEYGSRPTRLPQEMNVGTRPETKRKNPETNGAEDREPVASTEDRLTKKLDANFEKTMHRDETTNSLPFNCNSSYDDDDDDDDDCFIVGLIEPDRKIPPPIDLLD